MNQSKTKKTVVIKGPSLTNSGYGVHSRQICKWALSKESIDCKFMVTSWGQTPWTINPESFDGLAGKIMKSTVSDDFKSADVSIQVQLPNEWNTSIAKYNIGVTAGIETDICNPSWLHKINEMDKVIVPSSFSKQTFENTSKNTGIEITTEIEVVPEAYSDNIDEDSFVDEKSILDMKLDATFHVAPEPTLSECMQLQ